MIFSRRRGSCPALFAAVFGLAALPLLLLAASPLEAASQTRNLFGQEQFTRTSGAQNVFQRTFTVPAYVSSP